MQLQNGRPTDSTGRATKELRCYDFLDNLGIGYARVGHAPAATMDICADIGRVLGAPICKNLLLCNRQCTDFYLLLMPGDKPFKTKDLSAQIGSSRLSFADGRYMEAFLDITPGSLSILGLMNDQENRVRLLIDTDLLSDEFLGCHPCVNTSCVRLRMHDVQQLLIPALGHTPQFVTLPRYEEG